METISESGTRNDTNADQSGKYTSGAEECTDHGTHLQFPDRCRSVQLVLCYPFPASGYG